MGNFPNFISNVIVDRINSLGVVSIDLVFLRIPAENNSKG